MCLSVCIYILYYVTIQYIDIIIIYIYILYYRDHIASCWSPFFNNWWPVGVPGYMGIRANSRLLRTLPSKLPCTTVTKPWHVEKQCHEPSIWEWVIPPIKMVKNWGWFIFFTNIHVFFLQRGPTSNSGVVSCPSFPTYPMVPSWPLAPSEVRRHSEASQRHCLFHNSMTRENSGYPQTAIWVGNIMIIRWHWEYPIFSQT